MAGEQFLSTGCSKTLHLLTDRRLKVRHAAAAAAAGVQIGNGHGGLSTDRIGVVMDVCPLLSNFSYWRSYRGWFITVRSRQAFQAMCVANGTRDLPIKILECDWLTKTLLLRYITNATDRVISRECVIPSRRLQISANDGRVNLVTASNSLPDAQIQKQYIEQ